MNSEHTPKQFAIRPTLCLLCLKHYYLVAFNQGIIDYHRNARHQVSFFFQQLNNLFQAGTKDRPETFIKKRFSCADYNMLNTVMRNSFECD
jgi:hypothetical protein